MTKQPADRYPTPPENLSQAQRDFIQEHSQTTAVAAVRSYTRAAMVGFVLLLGGVGYTLYDARQFSNESRDAIVNSGRAVAIDGCNRDFESSQRFTKLLIRADKASASDRKAGNITAAVRLHAKEFYANEIRESSRFPDCRNAASVITDNIDATVRLPVPRFPGDYTK